MTDPDIAAIARGLTEAQRDALGTLPLPRDANPVYLRAQRPYSSTWRKSAAHFLVLVDLEIAGIVESKISRGERLWRLTRPTGLAVRKHLQGSE